MRYTRHIKTAILLIAVVCLVYPAFSGEKRGPNEPAKITGEIVKIHTAFMAKDTQVFIVADGDGQQWRVRVPLYNESIPGAYQVGDTVRLGVAWPQPEPEEPTDGTTETAMVTNENGSGNVGLLRNVRNRRTGEKIVYRDSQGDLIDPIKNQHKLQNKFEGKAETGGHAVKFQSKQQGGNGARQGGGGGGGRR